MSTGVTEPKKHYSRYSRDSVVIHSNPTKLDVAINSHNTKTIELRTIYDEKLYNRYSNIFRDKIPKIKYNEFQKCKSIIQQGTGVYTTQFLGEGSYNRTYKINFKLKDGNNKIYILRVTKPNTDFILNGELYGLFVQSYLHQKCPNHICNVHDFGKCYTVDSGKKVEGVYALLEYLPILCEEHMFTSSRSKSNIVEFENKLLHRVFIGLFTALKCIQDNKFAHLDLKPENFGFDKDNNLKLFDFGMAAYFPKNEDCVESGANGSPLYMDYNSIYKKQLCLKSDVWSAGIILYGAWYDNKQIFDYAVCAIDLLGELKEYIENVNQLIEEKQDNANTTKEINDYDTRIMNEQKKVNEIYEKNATEFSDCVTGIKGDLIDESNLRKVVKFAQSPDYSKPMVRTKIYGLTTDQIEHIKFLITQILDAKFNSNDCLAYYIKNINNGSLNSIAAMGGKKRTIRRTTRKCTQKNSRKSRRCQRK